MPNFKVGDRVKINKGFCFGEIGVIKGEVSGYDGNVWSVEFFKHMNGHSCRGLAKNGYGWNFMSHDLDLLYSGGTQEEEE